MLQVRPLNARKRKKERKYAEPSSIRFEYFVWQFTLWHEPICHQALTPCTYVCMCGYLLGSNEEERVGLVFRSDDTMETLWGEISGWTGVTMVTQMGLRTSKEMQPVSLLIPGCSRDQVPSDIFSFSQPHSLILKSHKNKEEF